LKIRYAALKLNDDNLALQRRKWSEYEVGSRI